MKVYAKIRYDDVVLSGWVFGEATVGGNFSIGLIGKKNNGADFNSEEAVETILRDAFGDDLVEYRVARR